LHSLSTSPVPPSPWRSLPTCLPKGRCATPPTSIPPSGIPSRPDMPATSSLLLPCLSVGRQPPRRAFALSDTWLVRISKSLEVAPVGSRCPSRPTGLEGGTRHGGQKFSSAVAQLHGARIRLPLRLGQAGEENPASLGEDWTPPASEFHLSLRRVSLHAALHPRG